MILAAAFWWVGLLVIALSWLHARDRRGRGAGRI
jgi:hypothetical protein